MEYLISSVKIIDKNSPHHLQVCDVKVQNGIISQIAPAQSLHSEQIFEAKDACLSVGWLDLWATIPQTGQEYKETFAHASRAACFGGFTDVLVLPHALPVRQSREAMEYVKQQSLFYSTSFYPIAPVSLDTEGKQMTEMYELAACGAVAFSDGWQALEASAFALNVLQYLKALNAVFICLPIEEKLQAHATMHEGKVAASLGLKAMPAFAEKTAVWRFLELVRYTQARLHFSCISTAEAIALIRDAKEEGLPVTCDIAAYQLAFTDEDLKNFDTNLKVNPPLRDAQHQAAIRQGLANGTIDCIVSAHQPQDEESKKLEFDLAEFGMINLQTAFASACTFSGLEIEQLVEKFAQKPREILAWQIPVIKVGEKCSLTIFNPKQEWFFEEKMILSKSKNSPFVGKKLKGKVLAIIQNGKLQLC